jgi:hypothetical protein
MIKIFLSKEENAKYHLEYLCPCCPEEKKRLRYVNGDNECWWNKNWKNGNFDIPRTFGLWNYVREFFGLEPNLDAFQKYDKAA